MSELQLPPSHFPAKIMQRSVDPKITERAIATLTERQPDLVGVSPDEIFTWPAMISNQRLDSYFTKMALSSLRNYSQDATDGVAFMNSHRHNELPLGYSLSGQLDETDSEDGTTPSVRAEFYTIRGLNLNGLATDQFIRGVETGLIRDVSIGFSGGTYTCSICGNDLFDWMKCRHMPGVEYTEIENPDADPEDQIETRQTCFAWVEDARLSEVSAVFDGACPDAMITKAQQGLEQGHLNPKVRQFLETQYRFQLKDRLYIPANTSSNKEKDMKDENSGAPEKRAEMFMEVRGVAKSSGFDLRVGSEDDVITVVSQLGDEITRLKPFESQAAQGQILRSRLTADAIKEGIRAFGDEFDKEKQQAALDAFDIDTVDSVRDSWKQIGDAKFAGKGRTSQDDPEGTNPAGDPPPAAEGEADPEGEVEEDFDDTADSESGV